MKRTAPLLAFVALAACTELSTDVPAEVDTEVEPDSTTAPTDPTVAESSSSSGETEPCVPT